MNVISPWSVEGLVILIPLIGTTLASLIVTVLNARKTKQIETTIKENTNERNEKLDEIKTMVGTVASTTETNKKIDELSTKIDTQHTARKGEH